MYNEDYEDYSENDSYVEEIHSPDKKTLGIIAVILVILIFATTIFFSRGIDEGVKLKTDDGDLQFSGTLSVNGEIVDTFYNEGEKIKANANGNDKTSVVIGTSNLDGIQVKNSKIVNLNGGKITLISGFGDIELSDDQYYVDENGNIVVEIDPNADLGVDPSLIDFDSNEPLEFELQIVTGNDETGEEYVFQIPAEMYFSEFVGTGCIQLGRGLVNEPTHYGELIIDTKIKITCDSFDDLYSFVEWNGDPKGNVEVHFKDTYSTNLSFAPLAVKSNPNPDTYDVKIIYVPHVKEKGQKADFRVNFQLENSNQSITFKTINENLEQCVLVETIDDTIEGENDEARIRVDTTKCINPVEISICDNDYGCSGGAEGEIFPQTQKFTLDKSSRTVSFSRGEIPGVYGATVVAKVKGFEKVKVSEKEIFVLPTDETIFPKRFVVSLMGKGARDSVTIRNTDLAENYEVEASICNLYESSLGIDDSGLPLFGDAFSGEEEWISSFATDPNTYGGTGFYQSALSNSLQSLSSARYNAFSTSALESSKIKRAYLDGLEIEETITTLDQYADKTIDEIDELNAAIDDQILNDDIKVGAQIISLVGTISSINSSAIALCLNIGSDLSAANSADPGAVCGTGGTTSMIASLTTAQSEQCSLSGVILADLLFQTNNMYSLYQQLNAQLNKQDNIDGKNAYESAKEIKEKTAEAVELMGETIEYLDLALSAASINDFTTASKEFDDAKYYLELAKNNTDELVELTKEIRESQTLADESFTVLIEEEPSDAELAVAITSALVSIVDLLTTSIVSSELVSTSLVAASESSVTAAIDASSKCASSYPSSTCCSQATALGAMEGKILATNAKANGDTLLISSALSTAGLALQGLEIYDQAANSYSEELTTARTTLTSAIEESDTATLASSKASSSLEEAIKSAEKLSTLTKETSANSTYLSNLNIEQKFHDFDRERLVGLVSTLYQSGYVAGAYSGGVYSAKDTGLSFAGALKEDCDNTVKLTLPDYKTNLMQDALNVEVDKENILTQWLFRDAKIFGVYEEQEVDLLFANDNLKQNTYATITIKYNENRKNGIVKPTGTFGPFNLADDVTEEKEYKFHMKFNVAPRIEPIKESSALCNNTNVLGATGEEALPNTLLTWDFESINPETTEGKYLDATQLSILLTKNISAIDAYLSNTNVSCPKNPVSDVILNLVPRHQENLEFINQLTGFGQDYDSCFLPLSTITFDDYPALYYYLDQETEVIYNDNLFEVELPSTASEFLKLMDFNINLIRDGYGTDFQNDFYRYFTTKILSASPSFLDPDKGISKYFRDKKKFYFTSDEKELLPSTDFIINDAGLYRVKLIIDFDEVPLIIAGRTTSKIKVQLEPIKPISENVSPFYYLPFDGGVGLDIDNARRFFGIELNSSKSFPISKATNTYAIDKQRDALVKLDYSEEQDIFELNSVKSMQGKLLTAEYSEDKQEIKFSPNVATPLLFEINGNSGESAFMKYKLKTNTKEVPGKTHNLFLHDSIDTCKDFYGYKMDYVRDTPDILLSGTEYGIGYDYVDSPGKVFTSTIAYAPISGDFELDFEESKEFANISSVNTPTGSTVFLSGIDGFEYNNKNEENTIGDLKTLFEAVKNRDVCISRRGTIETYYWSEERLIDEASITTNTNFKDKLAGAKLACIK